MIPGSFSVSRGGDSSPHEPFITAPLTLQMSRKAIQKPKRSFCIELYKAGRCMQAYACLATLEHAGKGKVSHADLVFKILIFCL